MSPDDLDELQIRANELIRKEEGLLFPQQIEGIRNQLGLTQPQFERLLGVGPKTVVRWEKGTVFQNSATDSLLRVLRDVPEAAAYLASRQSVALNGGLSDAPESPESRQGENLYAYSERKFAVRIVNIGGLSRGGATAATGSPVVADTTLNLV